jgi:phage terminase large subunit-like protein
MADWSHKNIEDVEIGDKVVGLVPGVRARRVHLIETEVTAKTVKLLEMYEYGTAEGGVVKCTPDHKWWTGRNGNDFHRAYAPLGKLTNGSTLRRVISLVEPAALSRERSIVAGYLGGIFDGEGGFSGIRVNEGVGGGGTVHISQTEGRNSVVCERIRESFDALDLPYSAHHPKTRAGWSQRVQFYLRGGRQKRYEFLRYCNPAKQRDKIIKSLMGSCSGKHGYSLSKKENVTSWRSLGVQPAYSITTGTGNYIAEGYVSKNSAQMIGNPIADSDKRFELGWLRFFEREPDEERIGKNVYILVDPARSQKKGSDYTVVWVIGLGPDRNYYCLDLYRERLNVPDFLDLLFDLVTIWRPIKVFEEVFGAQRDVEHIRERQKLLGYRFDIDEVPEVRTPKEERIEALMVPMADGRFWFPKGGYGHTAKGDHRDALTVFKEDEYEFWTPAGTTMHDDMLDCLGFLILDKMKAQLRWPVRKVSDSYDRGRKLGRVSRRGVSGERTAWSW